MKRCLSIAVALMALLSFTLGNAEALETISNKKEIIRAYQQAAEKIRQFQGIIHLQIQHLYSGRVTQDMPEIFEQTYFLPKENAIYEEHDPLFFKSFALVEWRLQVKKDRQDGVRKIVNASTEFFPTNPLIPQAGAKVLKNIKISEGIDYTFTIFPVAEESSKPPKANIYIPEALNSWHYIPDLWYPNLEHLGFPKDLRTVSAQGSDQLAAFVYIPHTLEDGLLSYFRQTTLNPDLQPASLRVTIVIHRETHHCKSVVISLRKEKEPQILFNITNSGATPSLMGFSLPSTTVFYTDAAGKIDGARNWNTHYFSQFTLKSFERAQ